MDNLKHWCAGLLMAVTSVAVVDLQDNIRSVLRKDHILNRVLYLVSLNTLQLQIVLGEKIKLSP